jgi:nitroreductase
MHDRAGAPPSPDLMGDLLYQRYRERNVSLPLAADDTLAVLLAHRSVRAYTSEPLPAGTLATLIAAAQSASSSSNLQAWSVVAVEDTAHKSRLAALAGNQPHIAEAPLFLVWLVDLRRLALMATARGQPSAGLDYLESFLMGAVDASLAAQNAVIALEAMGLGVVYIGAVRNKPAEIAAELGLPPQVFALFGLCVGHPDPSRPAHIKPRLPQEAVLFRERYGNGDAERNAIDAYNQRLRSFQGEEGLTLQDWSTQASDRIRDAKALNGRDVLSAVLNDLGFALK